MAAKKKFPPRAIENVLGGDYDEVKLRIGLRLQASQIVMQFSDHVERIRMSTAGARKLAALLIEKADEQVGKVWTARVFPLVLSISPAP